MTRPLHVLLMPGYYPGPENPVTGLFMRDLAVAISFQNRVTVLAPPSAASPNDAIVGEIRTIRLREPLRQGRADTIQRILALNSAISRLRAEGAPVDILHAHNFLTGAIAVLVGRVRKLPVVITDNQSRNLTGELSTYEVRLARFAYGRASVVCPVSRVAEDRLRVVQPHARYEVIPDVVDIDRFAAIRRSERTDSVSRIVAVSNLIRRKGLDHLIEAVRMLGAEGRDVTLAIAGEGPERAALEAQAEGMPIRLLGSCSRGEILNLLRDADAFAMPTLGDPFGIGAVEAFAAGVPVVVTSASGSADLLGQLGATVVAPGDPAALCSGLAKALDTQTAASAAAVDELRNYCGVEAVGMLLDSIYGEVSGMSGV